MVSRMCNLAEVFDFSAQSIEKLQELNIKDITTKDFRLQEYNWMFFKTMVGFLKYIQFGV